MSDTAVETHPVGNSIFIGQRTDIAGTSRAAEAMAFASDGDGDWDIYVTFSTPTLGADRQQGRAGRGRKRAAPR